MAGPWLSPEGRRRAGERLLLPGLSGVSKLGRKLPRGFARRTGGLLGWAYAGRGRGGNVGSAQPRPVFDQDLHDSILGVGQTYLPPAWGWIGAGLLAAGLAATAFRAPAGAARWPRLGLVALALAVTAVMNAYEGIPVPVLLVLGLASVLTTVAHHTPFGRHLCAIGGRRSIGIPA